MNKKGLLIVISAPSGTGKGTVIKELLKADENMKLSISATTRHPREGERNGIEYHFMTKEEFESLINENGTIEYAQYCENYYGTPRKQTEEWLENGNDVILEIDVQGKEQVKKNITDSISIFIMPPSFEILEHRLKRRGTETEDVVEKRLNASFKEMEKAENYDYIVINDKLEDCVQDILSIIKTEKMKPLFMNDFVKGVLGNV